MHVGVQGKVFRRQMAFLKIGFWNIYGPFIWLSLHKMSFIFARLKRNMQQCGNVILKKLLFKIVISEPFQSCPSSAILVPFCFRINPLMFSSLGNHYF